MQIDYTNAIVITPTILSQINGILSRISSELANYLQNVFPELSTIWWDDMVAPNLSYDAQNRLNLSEKKILSNLDLAGLLKVFDKNWRVFQDHLKLDYDFRNFLKEMQTIRNRWAHITAAGFGEEDVYRDLDTMQRFSMVISHNTELLDEIKTLKKMFGYNLPNVDNPPNINNFHKNEDKLPEDVFSVGQLVCLKAQPNNQGVITSTTIVEPENKYSVFINGSLKTYYESQLQSSLATPTAELIGSIDEFKARMSAMQILHPGSATLYSLNAARIDFIPYQFRPVLKFIRADRPRLLIADSVGVGKTIEAGLILRELQARRTIKSVLIICPRPLVTEKKWLNEMRRFDERFTHLDGKLLRHCIEETDLEGAWPEEYQKAILPYSLFDEQLLWGKKANGRGKSLKGLMDLDPPPKFDLVIVDEAHHIRNTQTFTHKAVQYFCDYAEAVLFLTATPVQMGSQDLYVLLNALRPDLFIDPESYHHMAAPNPFINEAIRSTRLKGSDWMNAAKESLGSAISTAWGQACLKDNPVSLELQSQLSKPIILDDERVSIITKLENLHTLSGIINRTRRRDIGQFTLRKPETREVDFTAYQRHLHDELLEAQKRILISLHGDQNVKFMMSTLRRQTASCLFGLAPMIKDILMRRMDELSIDEADSDMENVGDEIITPLKEQINNVLDMANNLPDDDPKFEELFRIVWEKQKLENKRMMVFSSFRHTLSYLEKKLKDGGFRVGLIHGGIADEDRVLFRTQFQLTETDANAIDIMLFSEVGCEGLDYQFCDCIVNYDLPWNPMKIEQRIGRIDRNGQKSESVVIYNMITPDTVDADIYERCLLRIGVFNSAIGDSEEILGEISKEIKNIADDFSLSSEQRKQKLEQLSDNQIRLSQEQERLEETELELFGIRLPDSQMRKDIEDATNHWINPEAIQNLITQYLRKNHDPDHEFILGEKPQKSLRLSVEDRKRLLDDYNLLPRQTSQINREWERWLKGATPTLSVTFDSRCAMENPKTVFLMPTHPLVIQAAKDAKPDVRTNVALTVCDDAVEPGDYPFCIYEWRLHGIREDQAFKPVSNDPILSDHLQRLLERATLWTPTPDTFPSESIFENLDQSHYQMWLLAKEKHQSQTREIAKFRRESLKSSHQARLTLLQEQLAQATDEKIVRMRQSQITSAEQDYYNQSRILDIATERVDITTDPIVYGYIKVTRE